MNMVEREERHHRMLGTELSSGLRLQSVSWDLSNPLGHQLALSTRPLTSTQLSPQKRFACWESSPPPPAHEFLQNHSASIFLVYTTTGNSLCASYLLDTLDWNQDFLQKLSGCL